MEGDQLMTTEEAVAKIAKAFADAEEAVEDLNRDFRETADAWKTLHSDGVIGGIEAQKHYRRMTALSGQFIADLYTLHSELTERAKELGVDLPQPRSGGGR